MGDRGNIVMEYGDKKRIYFYSHWRSSYLPRILQTALQKQWRWNDKSYLARIIFNELTKGQEKEETGFGIAPYMCDNEHDLLIVNPTNQTVTRATETKKKVHQWTFQEFINIDVDTVFSDY